MSSHLLLCMQRMTEYQSVMQSLSQKMRDLEAQTQQQQTTIVALEAALVASTAALKVSEARHERALHDQIKSVDHKATKAISNLSSEIHSELGKIRRALPPPPTGR